MDELVANLVDRINRLLGRDAGVISWEGPASNLAISQVQAALGVRLPESFLTFLRHTGGGGHRGLCISSLSSSEPLSDSFGSIYGDTLYYREDWDPHPLPSHLVVIERDADDNEPFCLDTSRLKDGECPVVLYYLNSGYVEDIAPDFLTFYVRYLQPYFEAAAPN